MKNIHKKIKKSVHALKSTHTLKPDLILKILSIVLFLLVAFAVFTFVYLSSQIKTLALTLGEKSTKLAERTKTLENGFAMLDEKATGLSDSISATDANLESTKQNVATVQSQVGGVQQTVGQISGTVTNLEKLSKTDPELLQKYSKVFFLNEHYAPERISDIPKTYLYHEENPDVIHAGAFPYLKKLLDSAKANNVSLYVMSAYRSFDEQKYLKSAYAITFGAGTANQFSADQGYSEHQLGTTVDFITTGLGGELEGFESTGAYQWMLQNAHKFGFTLSYPEGNSFYVFEPWHWRFVGVNLATYLFNENKNFYDVEQRKIDEYLVSIFE